MEKTLAVFDDYRLREVSFDRDALQLASWISLDDFHHHLKPTFFTGQLEGENGYLRPDPRPTCYALEDANGVVFFIRIDRAARVNIQFEPRNRSAAQRARVARSLLKGMAFLEVGLAQARVSEWIFNTRFPMLNIMARKRLGFVESPDELVRIIPLLKTREEQEEPSEAQEQPSSEVQ